MHRYHRASVLFTGIALLFLIADRTAGGEPTPQPTRARHPSRSFQPQVVANSQFQRCGPGSGSGLDPDSMGPLDPYSDQGEQK